ncbi:probable tRNA N6-adenosine threonylcarbamoyltransferase, mitochondrial isoform X2 [Magnolia sinica]|uniref:probable tRNA N6-adenosine threonylcarbamoyltransferase, mitochondrial isoform X2 n=1 Tax=Magnolia sinica TaxID=86752 RepID=UPI00265860A8|nr:probable tRNA N6-adenosine threonylcarbamoyltransferase, mitochondrial isoform X2 [Magnolia sinica]
MKPIYFLSAPHLYVVIDHRLSIDSNSAAHLMIRTVTFMVDDLHSGSHCFHGNDVIRKLHAGGKYGAVAKVVVPCRYVNSTQPLKTAKFEGIFSLALLKGKSEKMGACILTSSTIHRFNLLLRVSFSHAQKAFSIPSRQLPKCPSPSLPPLILSFRSFSTASSAATAAAPSNPQKCRSQASGRDFGSGDDLLVLGIETSCDDTAAAVVRGNGEILSQVVSSQADLLSQYGGVAPKMAEEAHSQVIDEVVQQALDNANLTERDLSAVAVTIGPGLSLCLRVGVQKARRTAGKFNLPIIGIHHMEAHALVARLIERDLQFPFLALLISGGHNLLILAHDLGQYVQLGTTIDDAIGEAYDKTARWLGLDMRKGGGPALEELAREGDSHSIKFSTPMQQHKDCNFSYAGLKTQVRLAIESKNIETIGCLFHLPKGLLHLKSLLLY